MKISQNNKSYIFLSIPFIVLLIVNFFLPEMPIKDEQLFLPTIKQIGANYLPDINQIRKLNSPMGPVFFIIWGLIGKLTDFSLFIMRSIHIMMSFGLVILVHRIFKTILTYPLLGSLFFIFNPYFILLAAPLLYTDLTALLFLFTGVYYYLVKQNRLLTGLFLGLAICTRQLLIIIPIALILAEFYWWIKHKVKFRHLVLDLIPFLCFLPLFVLWNFNVNSGFRIGTQFEENTLSAFSFSLKTLNYSFLLLGIYIIPFWLNKFNLIISHKKLFFLIPVMISLIVGFPINVNANLPYGDLPDTAGLLDIFMIKINWLAYIFIPLIYIPSILIFIKMFQLKNTLHSLFYKLSIFLFLLLESIYSYCWDKHFITILPFVFLLMTIAMQDKNKQPALLTDNINT